MMRLLFLLILSFYIFGFVMNKVDNKPIETSCLKQNISLDLAIDSGYILKKMGVDLLLKLGETKKKFKSWYDRPGSDTIGRYFYSKSTGNYVLCIKDYSLQYDFETHVLIELKPLKKNKFQAVACERYFHGNYPSCWENNYNGFKRNGDWFYFKECGTGSSLWSTNTYYFKKVSSQYTTNSILEDVSFCAEDICYTLSTDKQIGVDKLKFIYDYKEFLIVGDSISDEIKTEDKFTVIYEWKNGIWVANDSTKIKQYEFF